MYLILLFASVLLGASRSANVNNHIKLLTELDNNIENNAVTPTKQSGTLRFLTFTHRPRATYTHSNGEVLELTCDVIGAPAPSIHWFKNDAPVYEYDVESNELKDSNPTSLARVISTLLVTKTVDQDVYTSVVIAGTKTARSTTVVYSADDSTQLSERAKLFPLQPRIVVTYEMYVDTIGNNIVLPCRVKGHPKPHVVWRDNRGALIEKDDRMKVVLRSGELVISSLRWSDMGQFTCYATNVFGSQLAKTFVYPARISSFFGLAPLRFESRSNGFTVTISGAMCVYSYILVTVLVICTIFGLVVEINVGVEFAAIAFTTAVIEAALQVDNSIGGQYSVVSERKLCIIILAILVFFIILIADDFTFYALQAKKLDREWDIVTNYIGFYLLWFVVMILDLQFALRLHSLPDMFLYLKPKSSSPLNIYAIRVAPSDSQRSANVSLLVDVMTTREQSVIIKRTASGESRLIVSPCDAVRRLASLHGRFCDVVKRIDDSYGLPLVVILISTLLHLIVTPYFLIMEIIVSTNRVHFLVLQYLWCVTHMLRMIVVVEPGHYSIAEGKRTEGLVCRLMTSAPSTGVLPSRLDIFSRQLLLESVSYAPMGMCTLSRPLMASVIGAVTTYLVILIQFQRYDN